VVLKADVHCIMSPNIRPGHSRASGSSRARRAKQKSCGSAALRSRSNQPLQFNKLGPPMCGRSATPSNNELRGFLSLTADFFQGIAIPPQIHGTKNLHQRTQAHISKFHHIFLYFIPHMPYLAKSLFDIRPGSFVLWNPGNFAHAAR
jgi:hypothetical protein